jgi:hypothetical protein
MQSRGCPLIYGHSGDLKFKKLSGDIVLGELKYLCCHKGRLNSTNVWYSVCLVVTVYR